jgi:putative redox protein
MPKTIATWTSGRQFVAETETGHAVVMDAPVAAGGRNTAASPMELLLVGLAGCTGIDVVFILAERMKKPLTGLAVEVSGTRADTEPKVYTQINVTYRVRGKGLAEKDVRRAISLSAEKYCSASVMLGKTATITSSFTLTDDETSQVIEGTIEHA